MKKLLILGAALIMCLTLFAGCANNDVKYNAVLYDDAESLIDEVFAKEHRVSGGGVHYQDGDYSTATVPERTFFINSTEEYEEIFADSAELEVDFDSQMLIVYTFSLEYKHPLRLKGTDLNDNTLAVTFEMKLVRGTDSVCQPYQRWEVLKMDKMEISAVTIEIDNKYVMWWEA